MRVRIDSKSDPPKGLDLGRDIVCGLGVRMHKSQCLCPLIQKHALPDAIVLYANVFLPI